MKKRFTQLITTSTIFYSLFLLGILWITNLVWNSLNDDAYIFFRYAENIASGKGWVFNTREHINALTSVLYPLILAFIGFLKINIPGAGYIIYLIFLWFSMILLFQLLSKQDWIIAAMITPFLILFHSFLSISVGVETSLNLLLILGSLYSYLGKKYNLTALLLGLLILTRYDGVLLGFILLGDYLITQKKFPYISFLIILGIVLPWFCFSYAYFHTILPSSFNTKMAFGKYLNSLAQLNYWDRFKRTFVEALPLSILGLRQTLWISLTYLGIVFIMACIAYFKYYKSRLLRIITIWIIIYSLSYAYLNVPFEFVWYWVPNILYLSILVGLGLQGIYDSVQRLQPKFKSVGILAVIILALGFIGTEIWTINTVYHTQFPSPREKAYEEVGIWIADNTSRYVTVSTEDIGVIGYYSKRKIIDLFGLATPKVIDYYRKGNSSGIIRDYKPEYMVVHKNSPQDSCNAFLLDSQIVKEYQEVTTFYYPNYRTLQIYKRLNH